jgi:hypothetical protein
MQILIRLVPAYRGYARTVIVLASRRYRIKISRDGRDYLVLGYAFDVRESAEEAAGKLSTETGDAYRVVEA